MTIATAEKISKGRGGRPLLESAPITKKPSCNLTEETYDAIAEYCRVKKIKIAAFLRDAAIEKLARVSN